MQAGVARMKSGRLPGGADSIEPARAGARRDPAPRGIPRAWAKTRVCEQKCYGCALPSYEKRPWTGEIAELRLTFAVSVENRCDEMKTT